MPRLQKGVVPGANCTHRSRLIARVGLGRVLKVGIGPARTVDANVSRHVDVGAAVRLAHDGDDGNAGGGAHWFRLENGTRLFDIVPSFIQYNEKYTSKIHNI